MRSRSVPAHIYGHMAITDITSQKPDKFSAICGMKLHKTNRLITKKELKLLNFQRFNIENICLLPLKYADVHSILKWLQIIAGAWPRAVHHETIYSKEQQTWLD